MILPFILFGIFILAVVALLIYIVRPRRLSRVKRCKHQFTVEAWTNLNEDARCVHCKKWFSLISKDETFNVTWDADGKHVTLDPVDI